MGKLSVLVFSVLLLASCGGTAAPAGSIGAIMTPPPSSGPPAPSNAPGVVTIGGGQTAGGIDISVPAAAGSPAPNAQDLGVADLSGAGSAYNSGDIIHAGNTSRVLMFGPGLTDTMTVSILGPADIADSNITAIQSTGGTSGISFLATVNPNATPGARTVLLKAPNGDVTAFTGGLEVAP